MLKNFTKKKFDIMHMNLKLLYSTIFFKIILTNHQKSKLTLTKI